MVLWKGRDSILSDMKLWEISADHLHSFMQAETSTASHIHLAACLVERLWRVMQGCLYGGQNEGGHLGDAWLFNAEAVTWQQTATFDLGGFSDGAKAWHAAAILKCTDVSS